MNEPAFPCKHYPKVEETFGMSLRDYFAIHATETDVEKYSIPRYENANNTPGEMPIPVKIPGNRVEARYRFADAMLEARKSQK